MSAEISYPGVMELIASIEYHTVWGQDLYLRSGDRLWPMEYGAGGIWTAVVNGLRAGQDFEYRYEVHSGGFCIRTEWLSHRLTVSSGAETVCRIRDSWSDVPSSLPLKSAPFTDGVFQRKMSWKAAGTVVPVFSLRTEDSMGVGEFLDLKLLVDWAYATGQKIIQLLPVNDTTMTWTWEDSYPYNACSSFALHPQFINLPAAGLMADEEYLQLKSELNALPEVDYERVNREKHRLLRLLFKRTGLSVLSSLQYKAFYRENRDWLFPYAVFSVLRDEFGTADFSQWKSETADFSVYDAVKAEQYALSHRKEVDYWCFVQYHLHNQLLEARNYAHSKGVVFKGDLPIGVSRTSADAWEYGTLFNMDSQAGAPPDAFSTDGQIWGFPTYDWDEMSKDGYSWWKARLKNMSGYFDAFRIDHILGFFRIWEIPLGEKSGLMGHFNPALPYSSEELASLGFDMPGRTGGCGRNDVLFVEDPRRKGFWHPMISARSASVYRQLTDEARLTFDRLYDDFFYHRHNAFWKESAMKKLPALLSSTGMLACGEDLGMIPACVPEVMQEYSILSLEIQRMPKVPGQNFADTSSYPYYSVCTTSTHDMSPLRLWWGENRSVTAAFWREIVRGEGDAPEHCEPWICRKIIEKHLQSPSMLCIIPVQDWLSVDGNLRAADPSRERINVPAVSRYYWRYRMHLKLEDMISSHRFNGEIRDMVSASGR